MPVTSFVDVPAVSENQQALPCAPVIGPRAKGYLPPFLAYRRHTPRPLQANILGITNTVYTWLISVFGFLWLRLSLFMPLAVKSKRFGQTTHPNLYFRDGVLSIPGYTFEQVRLTSDVYADSEQC